MNDTDESFLWAMIDLAWAKAEKQIGERPSGEPGPLRSAILDGTVTNYEEAMRPFCVAFENVLGRILTRDGVLALVEAFETMLYRLDREEIAARVGLSGNEFLEARTFIVAMGREHYAAVLRAPSAALRGARAEGVYVAVGRAYKQRFKQRYVPRGLGVATGTNLEGWPSARARATAEGPPGPGDR